MTFKNFIIESLGDVIRLGGELVTDPKQIEERKAICENCPFKGIVTPLPLISTEGCTKCGCPFKTKLKTKKHFDYKQSKIVMTTCPHPEGNKWAKIDEKY